MPILLSTKLWRVSWLTNSTIPGASEPQIVELTQGYAVQIEVQTSDDETALTTIIPYKVDENDNLINSFQYLAQQNNIIRPMAESTVPTTFVDVTLTVKTYYAHYTSSTHFLNFYRHAGIEAWWSSNNSTVSVSSMTVNYETAGELYRYPDVMTQSLSSTKVQDYYYKKSSIVRSNPTKGTVYIDGNNTMPLDRVVLLTNYFDHGGLIYLKLTYSVNGTTRTNDTSYYVYSK